MQGTFHQTLVVDDNLINRKLLRAQLEAEGLAVLEAGDGAEALSILGCKPVDLIISDILMPRMDGYRFCYEVRKSPRLAQLPFIFYSNTYTSPADEQLALRTGADKFLRKPAAPTQILSAIKEVAKRQKAPCTHLEPAEELSLQNGSADLLVQKLESKTLELEQRSRMAALSVDAGLALANANSVRQMLQRCAESITLNLQAALARIWVLNEKENVLELQASAGMDAPIDGSDARVPVGQFKVGRIALERTPHLTN